MSGMPWFLSRRSATAQSFHCGLIVTGFEPGGWRPPSRLPDDDERSQGEPGHANRDCACRAGFARCGVTDLDGRDRRRF